VAIGAFLVYYVVVDWDNLTAWVGRHVGLDADTGAEVVEDSAVAVRRYFWALTLSAVVTAVLIGGSAWLLGIPLAFKDIVFQGTQSPVGIDGRVERVGFYNTFVGRADGSTALADGVRVEADEDTGDIHVVAGPHFRGIQFHAESILTEHGYDLIHDLVLELLR